jgi:predicted Zn-dependent protease
MRRILSFVVLFMLFPLLAGLPNISAAQETDLPKVNFYYLIPSDRDYNQNYVDGIEKAALSIQAFYSEQLGGAVFATTNPIVQVVYSPNNTKWHADQMWSRAIHTVGAAFNDPNNIYIIYVDAALSCTENNGIGGTSGIAVLAVNDLHGLAGEPIEPDCNGYVDLQDQNRWIGGLGHELGHALGLHHPDGCESGAPTCDSDSIMWLGFRDYPDTHFGADALDTLQNSGFFTPTYANPRAFPHTETFENGNAWHDLGEFSWSVQSGGTLSSKTGPASAAQGAYYLYFETSSGFANAAGDQAVLESDVFAAQDAKISFQYHMYGADVGKLSIEVSKNGAQWDEVWSASGQQHTSGTAEWTNQVVRLDSYSGNIKLRILATAAGGYRGDIAIDDLKIHNGIEILRASFDGTWFYTEWTPVSYADDYTQFVIGDYSDGRRWLYRYNSGATDRGDYVYQYYHRDDICDALVKSGIYELSAQVWPGSESSLGDSSKSAGHITCPVIE